jgi:RNA polymerase sigma-70 factor (ECF subfamily)
VEDDRLRLIFTCCHPALKADAQVALTLREVCGLTTEEIARAFLSAAPTIAQRIVRAKAKIRDAKIPYQVPARSELIDRLDSVLRVIYLVFNEGYSATEGDSLVRGELSSEAIRLGRLLVELLPEPEALGLLALMLLHESRRGARTAPDGTIVLLADQDRSQWNRAVIAEGSALVERAITSRRFGPYTLQAAIAAVHAEAPTGAATDWPADRRAVRRAPARRSVGGGGAEPRGGRRHARWPGCGPRAHRRDSGPAASSRNITSRMPRVRICAAASDGSTTRARHTRGRWSW